MYSLTDWFSVQFGEILHECAEFPIRRRGKIYSVFPYWTLIQAMRDLLHTFCALVACPTIHEMISKIVIS